jgi:hypothetical protein
MSTPLLHIQHLNAGYEQRKPILQFFSLMLHEDDVWYCEVINKSDATCLIGKLLLKMYRKD